MKKLFTSFLTLSLAISGLTAYAVNANNPYAPKGDEQVIGKTQVLHNVDKAKLPVLSGAELGAPSGWSVAYSGTEDKNIESGDQITINGTKYRTMKFSNGADHTVTLPNGYKANAVTIYSVTNKDSKTDRPCYWAQVGGQTFEKPEVDHLDSFKDFDNPAVSYFKLDGESNSFILKNGGEQQLVVLVVDYSEGDATVSPEEPGEMTYVVAHNIAGVSNTGYSISGSTIDNESITVNGTEYPCLTFQNNWKAGSDTNYVEVKPAGGLKKGDVLTFTSCIGNSDTAKRAAVKVSTADGKTLYTTPDVPNVKLDGVTDHGTYSYTLTQDYDSIMLSRDGNTKTHITTLAVTRGGAGGTTAVENIAVEQETETVIYDLSGRRVKNPSHGLYIINGKKVLVK